MLVFSRVSVPPPGVGDARVFSCLSRPPGWVMLAFSRVAVARGVGDARVLSCLSGPPGSGRCSCFLVSPWPPRGWVMLAFSRVAVAPGVG
jgi:hypothetical protein